MRTVARRAFGDCLSLGKARMVLPQPALRIEIVLEARIEGERPVGRSSGSGLEPVVSTPIPTTLSAEKPA
jgi:hypothetical protein